MAGVFNLYFRVVGTSQCLDKPWESLGSVPGNSELNCSNGVFQLSQIGPPHILTANGTIEYVYNKASGLREYSILNLSFPGPVMGEAVNCIGDIP